jgi:hypothetical protein
MAHSDSSRRCISVAIGGEADIRTLPSQTFHHRTTYRDTPAHRRARCPARDQYQLPPFREGCDGREGQ